MGALTAVPLVRPTVLDHLLDHIGLTLQIRPVQFEDAERRYLEVGAWLGAKDSPLGRFRSQIYAQGSMRLRTTVKPRESRGEEYDLDLVFEVDDATIGPMELYNMVLTRLRQHPDPAFPDRIKALKRCIRLEYAGFHLDILPARRNRFRTDGYIEVPDRDLRDWHPSNPNGYAIWFEARCAQARTALVKASTQQPLPEPEPADLLVSLRRVVQLTKRRRDNGFGDDGRAPRSVVLTTLAGDLYTGQQSTTDVLESMLAGIEARVAHAEALGQRLVVCNPSRPEEDFSERWGREREEYDLFKEFVRQFGREMAELRRAEGIPEQARLLNGMFGRGLGTRAVDGYMAELGRQKETGRFRHQGPALIVGGTAGRPTAPHTFHHGA
jgi:hypothetical protein